MPDILRNLKYIRRAKTRGVGVPCVAITIAGKIREAKKRKLKKQSARLINRKIYIENLPEKVSS